MGHTPGPWKIERDGGYTQYILDSTMLVRVADVCRIENTGAGGSTKANARLIAAAPELLAALKDVAKFYQDHFDEMPVSFQTMDDIVNAAIAAAEG